MAHHLAHLFFPSVTIFNTQLPIHIIVACRSDIQVSQHQEVTQRLVEVTPILAAQPLQASIAPIPNLSSSQFVTVESSHEQNENDTNSTL